MATSSSLVLIALLIAVASDSATGQGCIGTVQREGDPRRIYGPRSGGRYCDGEIETPHGGRIRIISVTNTGPAVLLGGHTVLLRVPSNLQQLSAKTVVTIQGLPLDASRNYRFDANLEAEKLPLMINQEAALWQLSLAPSSVGWTSWTQRPGEERVFWPINLGGASSPKITIILRSSINVAVLRVQVHEPTNKAIKQSIAMTVAPDEPITYDLPAGPPGLITLDIIAEGADGSSSEALSFQLWRPIL